MIRTVAGFGIAQIKACGLTTANLHRIHLDTDINEHARTYDAQYTHVT